MALWWPVDNPRVTGEEIITVEMLDGSQEHVIIAREDDSLESFPVDETNPPYQQFKAEIEGQ